MDSPSETMDTTQSPIQMKPGLQRGEIPQPSSPDGVKLETLRTAFDDNFQSLSSPVKHDKTAVLLLSWEKEHSDMDVKDELVDLQSLFEAEYNFKVDRAELKQGLNPQVDLNWTLIDFVKKNNDEHNLLIIYYAGHGFGDEVPGNLYLTGSDLDSRKADRRSRNRVAWSSAETCLQGLNSDVLVIFDCCHAGALQGRSPPKSCFEFLGACRYDQMTEQPGPHSFTSALIRAMQRLKAKGYFTSQDLQRAIIDEKEFPTDVQQPVLLSRVQPNDEHIWLSPVPSNSGAADDVALLSSPTRPVPHYRDEGTAQYLHFRFRFGREQDERQVRSFAKALSEFAKEHERDLSIKHVKLTDYMGLSTKDIVNRWRKLLTASNTGGNDTNSRINSGLNAYPDSGRNEVAATISGSSSTVIPTEVNRTASHEPLASSGEIVSHSENQPQRVKVDMRDIQEQMENSPNLWKRRPPIVAFKGFLVGVVFTVLLSSSCRIKGFLNF